MSVPAEREAALALLPALHDAHRALHDIVWDGPVPAPVLERCRIRMAQMLSSARALAERTPAAGLDDDAIERIAHWGADPALDAGARACLLYTEQSVMDPHGITDEDAAAVVTAYGEAGLVHLTTAIGLWENLHRFDKALGLLAASNQET